MTNPAHPAQTVLFPAAHQGCQGPCWCGQTGFAGQCGPEPGVGELHPADSDFDEAVAQIGGLDLSTVIAQPQPHLDLPDVLVQTDGSAVTAELRRATMAVTFSVMCDRAGRSSRSPRSLAERLRLPSGTRMGLLLFAKDERLEELWLHRTRWIEAFVRWHPHFVVAPNFSVWAGTSALTARYNIKRSLWFFSRLQAAGLTAIPHVEWGTLGDLAAWASWLNRYPDMGAIAMDRQAIGHEHHFEQWIRELREFRAAIRKPQRLLINGLDVGWQWAAVKRVWPELTATRNYIPEAANGSTVRLDARQRVARYRSALPAAELFTRRINFVEQYVGSHLERAARVTEGSPPDGAANVRHDFTASPERKLVVDRRPRDVGTLRAPMAVSEQSFNNYEE